MKSEKIIIDTGFTYIKVDIRGAVLFQGNDAIILTDEDCNKLEDILTKRRLLTDKA